MSRAAKRRVLHAGLLLFTLWPLLHIYLVMHCELSAWKLAGWGMYATPRPSSSGIAVQGRRNGSKQFEEIRSLPPEWQAEASHFLEWQRWLGQLIRPNQLARLLRADTPELADLRIIVYRAALERQTGMIITKEIEYDYPRNAAAR